MGAQLRIYRRRMRSVQSTKKITRAMELIAASRIIKAQQRVEASLPYAGELVRAIEAAATYNTTIKHPLTASGGKQERAAVLLITSDRGLAGAYSANAIKEGEALANLLRSEGKEVVPYLVGRKAISFYRFRGREVAGEWSGFSESPSYANAKEVAQALISRFLQPNEEGGVDEIHIVYTHFRNMIVQEARARRLLPLVVEESQAESIGDTVTARPGEGEGGETVEHALAEQTQAARSGEPLPLYSFEPSPEEVLDALLPRYIESLIYNAMLLSAASEHAARRRAMKAATDNAEELIITLTRLANQARQAEITQEISEIVGGADALAAATAGSE